MIQKNPNIVVTGDVCLNLLRWKSSGPLNPTLNYETYPMIQQKYDLGGALLLAKLIKQATNLPVITQNITDINTYSEHNVLISTAELDQFPSSINKKNKNMVYRVANFSGYYIGTSTPSTTFPILSDTEDADIVVLDDDNNGFNANEQAWPLAIKTNGKHPIILYKTNKIDFQNSLWMHIEKHHLNNTVVIINADDLRAKGVNISKGLSWEKTGLDFVWQMRNNPNLKHLSHCKHLIIPFGLEGAIYYHNDMKITSRLYFLTNEFEGGFIKEDHGKMYGLTSCFVAGLTKSISYGFTRDTLSDLIEGGIREGMVAAQRYYTHGFGSNLDTFTFPNHPYFSLTEHTCEFNEHIQDVEIKATNNPNCRGCWYIIKDKSSTNLEEIAYDIVKKGEDSALRYIPIAKFRNLKVVDRTEIEAYRSIKNLMLEYISTKNAIRPLSIAVFGVPGSGKSFGVTEVAASIAPNLIQKLDFNLSQFKNETDLIAAFHKVRDVSLSGKLPLVFFDEFDSAFGEPLGWLKYFLAPMQDGSFREGDSIHPIGKAIFVFAGGTSNTYESFCGENIEDTDKQEIFIRNFQIAKGPDFISRLRGYVNILGLNQTDKKWDQLFIIRRAMLLRSLLVRKTPHLINDKGEAQVDTGIIRALLKVSRFKHESRSMEAILEMSMLSDAKKWEQSHLPSKSQLKLHVDENGFYHYMMLEEFFSEKMNSLSNYLWMNVKELYSNPIPSVMDENQKNYQDLIKQWIHEQVKFIPNILYKANYELSSNNETLSTVELSEHELLFLAKLQHETWLKLRKKEGWSYDTSIDLNNKLHPAMTNWDNLDQTSKDAIINYVKLWPSALTHSKFQIAKLNYLCYCESRNNTKKQ